MNVNTINSVNLFEDLKCLNIGMDSFKEILSSYKKLEDKYIKSDQADLLIDLDKQKKVIFSYLNVCKNAPIKKISKMINEIEAEYGNFDEVDTFTSPDKNIELIKITHKDDKWTINANNLSEDLIIKEIPRGIELLVNLVNRLSEQEAAYALCHAKAAGKFVFAALPYVRTDMPDTAWSTRYMKDPTVPLGPYEKSEDSFSTHNMPVSRQLASDETDEFDYSDELSEGATFIDNENNVIIILTSNSQYIITADNKVVDIETAQNNLESGTWKRMASTDEAKLIGIKKQVAQLLPAWEEKLILDEAAYRLGVEFTDKVNKIISPRAERLEKVQESLTPKLTKLAAKIESIKFKDTDGKQKLIRLQEQIDNMIIYYNRPVEQYQKRVVPVARVEELIEEAKKYVSPRNLKAFEENIVNNLFKYISAAEKLEVGLSRDINPRNEELVKEEIEKLRKEIKTSQNTTFNKDAAYNLLDNMLIKNEISFNQYNSLSDLAELNSKQIYLSIKSLRASLNKEVKADFIENIKEKAVFWFNAIKNWLFDIFSFLLLEEKQITDINKQLDLLVEGE